MVTLTKTFDYVGEKNVDDRSSEAYEYPRIDTQRAVTHREKNKIKSNALRDANKAVKNVFRGETVKTELFEGGKKDPPIGVIFDDIEVSSNVESLKEFEEIDKCNPSYKSIPDEMKVQIPNKNMNIFINYREEPVTLEKKKEMIKRIFWKRKKELTKLKTEKIPTIELDVAPEIYVKEKNAIEEGLKKYEQIIKQFEEMGYKLEAS